jgi:hypothetical protein
VLAGDKVLLRHVFKNANLGVAKTSVSGTTSSSRIASFRLICCKSTRRRYSTNLA